MPTCGASSFVWRASAAPDRVIAGPDGGTIPGIETLSDRSEGVAVPLPSALRRAYGSELRFPSGRAHVFANFVSTVDGLVSYGIPGQATARVISRGHPGDRFVMGLLRAVAEVVVSGAGTLRVESGSTWTPYQVFPAAEGLFRELRRAMGLPESIRVALLSSRGEIDLSLPVFRSPGIEPLILTTAAGAARLATADLGNARLVAVEALTMRGMLDALFAETGARLVLSEAGPNLFGKMLDEGVIDELFLTLAPQLAGRSADRPGIGLVEATAFAPERAPWGDLVSVKRSGDYLLLRYVFDP